MSTVYQVVETETGEEQNFYDVSLPQALAWAKDCKRQMKSMTGKDYEIVVKTEDGGVQSLKEYAN
jgi:hypothetical protein|tara:strand:+ start:381 stop:575 length:195 start_codon:yes stop_codon:yes gene_type:complete